MAYRDIERAFQTFLEHNKDRPFFIASHSQGTLHATRLIEAVVDKDPCVERCVACYLLGMAIERSKFEGNAFRNLHPSSGPADLQAVVAWQLRGFETTHGEADFLVGGYGPGYWQGGDQWRGGGSPELLMTNPLTWSSEIGNDSASSHAAEPHKGIGVAVFDPPFNPMAVQSGKPIKAKLQRISRKFPKKPPQCRVTRSEVVMSNLPDWMTTTHLGTGIGDLHIFDYSWFFYNLRENITERLAAFERQQGRPPRKGFLPAKL